jgi:hypothetical protein
MSTGAVSPLLAALVDDASLFPPGNMPMSTAVKEHRHHRTGDYADLVGRFLCPASRLDELQAELVDDDRFAVSLILDTGLERLPDAVSASADDSRLRLTAIEVPIGVDGDPAAAAHEAVRAFSQLTDDIAAFVELPRIAGWRDALSLVAARGYGVKLRTGGLVADAFPSEIEVAEFVRASVTEGAPFKCTAGLHQAVRHGDQHSGFEHHGFLNILLATHAATEGGSVDDLIEILASKETAALVATTLGVDASAAAAIRSSFTGFGTCSVDEPVDDLAALGLIERYEPPPVVAQDVT